MERITDAAPVQYEGMINGRPFYFRARWMGWTFTVANTLDEAISTQGIFFRESTYGKNADASYMPHEEAEQIIRQYASEYLAHALDG